MKYFTFYRENNNFDDILNDTSIKKIICTKITWHRYLLIGILDINDQTHSLITLKYGDEMVANVSKDFTPVPGVDYIPKKDISRFKKVIS